MFSGILRYCVKNHFRAFGNYWVSGSLIGATPALLHVLAVLLCSAYRACSCSLLFKAPHPDPPPLLLSFLYSLNHSLLSKFTTVLPVQCDGCWGGGWFRVFLAGGAPSWVASRAGS